MGLEKILEEIDKYIDAYSKPPYGMEVEGTVALLQKCKDIIRKHMNDGWIPVEEQLPEVNEYILLSFENFDLPAIGRYETKEDGGAFYLGDCDEEDTCISQDLYVNAWKPLPEPYRPKEGCDKNDSAL